jgi:leucine dehydrogenase
MELFEEMKKHGHEQVMFFQEKKSGLKAVLAIHDTTLGPGLGGCRMWPYSSEEEMVEDALRLSKGMTYKSGIADVDFGGAKTVVWGNPEHDKTEGLLRALGHYINGLDGRYTTGTDVGTDYYDFVVMRKETPYVCALPKEYGGSGDSSVATAYGVFNGIKACVKYKYDQDNLEGRTVVIQGLGKVGQKLAKHLLQAGCKVYGCDIKEEYQRKAREIGVEIVDPEGVFNIECDIFSPNALGGVINDETIDLLKCDIIAGAANNVLAEPRHGQLLHERGILYAPDYLINSGGLIQAADELTNKTYNEKRVMKKCEGIYQKLLEVFKISSELNIPTFEAANHLVEKRLEAIASIHSIK